VEKDGNLSNIKILRGVSPSIDAEALRVIGAMPKWKPGMQRGQAVSVKYTIPVMFNLNDESQGSVEIKRVPYKDEFGFYMVADEMPEFPGGMAACMEWLQKNIRYPMEAFAKGETGRVIVQFVVEENGDLRQLKVVRGVSPSLDGEALRVVATMPKWKPGKVDGKPVKVNYTIPVAFRLTGGEEAKKTVSADELRKLPGTEVDENGNIKVNGKAVKGILVDGVAAEVK
jgi:TonB family protein